MKQAPTEQSGSACRVLAAAADAVLAQCAALLAEVSDTVYSTPSTTVQGGTIGKHLRHTLDHFAAALSPAGETIDYDHRERDRPMETDRAAALAAVAGVRERLATFADSAAAVRVRVMVCADGACTELSSTRGRELAFATHHAVHHQAMMRTIAGEFGIDVFEGFGKAPSTQEHERRRGEGLRCRA